MVVFVFGTVVTAFVTYRTIVGCCLSCIHSRRGTSVTVCTEGGGLRWRKGILKGVRRDLTKAEAGDVMVGRPAT